MILGITGSFGSGKTTISNLFKKYGFAVINVDKLYHGIYNKNEALRNKIKKEFGTLDRNKIKKIVFNDYQKLKKLNNITHPIIIDLIKKEISYIKKNKKIINEKNNNVKIIIDAPLLIEAKALNLVDKLIVVKCDKKEQINRLLKKEKHSKKEIMQIIKSQMPIEEKIKYADFVVDNSKSINETEKQVNLIISSP